MEGIAAQYLKSVCKAAHKEPSEGIGDAVQEKIAVLLMKIAEFPA